ncbi:MFS transporter [Planococcus shenhongbingii]|uniref:MFS transporter n=1 Tax=Planococcus shenhongbingii TaxID=3058398 RepID=A0ABT8NDM9_9BACL|nr:MULTISPECIES: MFS transporter [unclassified Planococcus (in: firmicutes)]MDN7245998.1 MFS transporter [Planococcus sp. N017]WKA59872.1 MFS transporter [Planococcus sp. N016]
MITRKTVILLGLSQLICWGISYYLIAAFGEVISGDLNWSRTLVYGGFSAALLIMGLTSPLTGKLIDQYSGRFVMSAGSILLAIGCSGIALSQSLLVYYLSWIVLGFAMRLTLYDAAFASLVRIAGSGAKRSISQITLLGGLASTIFWPIGFFLAESFGWRAALLVYAGFALLTLPLHLAIPQERFTEGNSAVSSDKGALPKMNLTGRERFISGSLYALIFSLLSFLNSAMSAHMIGILSGLGLAAAVSVWISTLRGIGQSLARVTEVLFGSRLHPFTLTIWASGLLPLCFIFGLFSGKLIMTAFIFAFLYGAGNGLMTIVRGSLPLVLFDNSTYGSFVGKLLMPSFLLSAIAPIVYSLIIEKYGEQAALALSAALAFAVFSAAVLLKKRYPYRTS